MSLPIKLINEAARHLEDQEEALRIKKVLFCLCKRYWENNLIILNAFSVSDLLEEILRNYSTFDSFKNALVKLIKTLNRPNIYTEVGKVVFNCVNKLYKYVDEEPQTAIVVKSVDNNLLSSVALKLQSHQEKSRIKKVVYSVCKKRWENDIQVIENYNFQDLIAELIQRYPTKEDLQKALIKLVQNINKQNLYLAISNLIVSQLGSLYNNRQATSTFEEEGNTQFTNTQFVQVNNSYYITPNPIEPQPLAHQNFGKPIIDLSAQPIIEQTPQTLPPTPQTSQPEPSPKKIDFFELRLEIMQYTNPLRAKVLLFSVLYQSWDKDNQDWAMLRSYSLDDLLRELIQNTKNLTDIESKLFAAARVLTDFESNMQTAGTIVEALKPFVANH
ncbi:MAG: hypothetical protein MUD14_16735 [Hydrococcus sp. Prado102]|jgi:hypothetical protein|nr:hypothetical protein [Hydrococcus sp. Prado102]